MTDPVHLEPRRPRLDAIDLLRGIVMVLMLLDHTRDFLHVTGTVDPTQLRTTTVPVFLTRFVTHYCASIFVLLAGVGARLQRERGKTPGELSRFLLTRGLWLVVLEVTVIRFGFAFSFDYMRVGPMLQVIWVIGISMIVLSVLVHLPTAVSAVLGVVIIVGSNLLDRVPFHPQSGTTLGEIVFMLLHAPGPISPFGTGAPGLLVLYPLLPWIGVLLCGYTLGGLYARGVPSDRRRRVLLWLALAGIALFLVLRIPNIYGDPAPWSVQERGPVFTALSFINVTKYPVSFLYLLLTLSPALAFLAMTDGRMLVQPIVRPLVTFGRVPLFFYILQWFVAHGAGVVLRVVTGHPEGLGLPAVYATWIAGVLLLYYPCRWFAGVKARRRDWWLSYL